MIVEFLNEKSKQCPRCKSERIIKENDGQTIKCEDCGAKFVLFTFHSKDK